MTFQAKPFYDFVMNENNVLDKHKGINKLLAREMKYCNNTRLILPI